MKNSIGKVLAGFEWEYDGPISIYYGQGYQGKGVSRTLFLTPKVEEIPEELFALKVSQSTDPAKAGKPVFKYFSFRFDPNAKFNNLAPTGITMDTDLAQIKDTVISRFANLPNVEVSINVHMNGAWTNITCADGTFALYDKDKFPNADPNKAGRAPYYIKDDAQIHVKLKGAESQGNEYLQSTLSTTASSNDIFQKVEVGKVWGGSEAEAPAAPAAPVTPEAPAGNQVW